VKVIVVEVGDPPVIATPARLNARAGARALADIMAEIDTIDMGKIVLDWKGDGITPVMTITAGKTYPGWSGRWITLDPWHIDIDDAFSRENMDNGGLVEIAQMVKETMQRTEDIGIAQGIV
jgi:hypothetical protein